MSEKSNLFKQYCKIWSDKFHLDYVIYFLEKCCKEDENKIAYAILDCAACVATIYLSTEEIDKLSSAEIESIAFEEICHLLLTPITYLLNNFYNAEYIIELEHIIINKMKRSHGLCIITPTQQSNQLL